MDFASRLQRAVDYDKDACIVLQPYFRRVERSPCGGSGTGVRGTDAGVSSSTRAKHVLLGETAAVVLYQLPRQRGQHFLSVGAPTPIQNLGADAHAGRCASRASSARCSPWRQRACAPPRSGSGCRPAAPRALRTACFLPSGSCRHSFGLARPGDGLAPIRHQFGCLAHRIVLAPMAIPNCSTYGRSNCSRQDERIMRVRA
jgi:hypothetical protein